MRRRGLQWTGLLSRCLYSRPAAHQLKANESWTWGFVEGLRNRSTHGGCFQRQWVRYYDEAYRNEFLRHKSQQNTVPPLFPFTARPYAEEIQKKRYRASNRKSRSGSSGVASSGFFSRVLRGLMKFVGGVVAITGAAVAGAPYLISRPFGLHTLLFVINSSIPGTLSVESVSLGWNKPIHIEGVILKGPNSSAVLLIPEYKTNAHLWTLVVGRAGLGDAVVLQPTLDMRNDPESGHPYYDLAVTSVDKLNVSNPYVKKKFKVLPSEVVSWTAKMRAPEGGLEVLNGKVILPGDLAAVLGAHLYFDIAFGSYATEMNPSLWKANGELSGRTPIRCSLCSNCAHLEALAYLNLRRKRMELLQPILAEMDLSPALAKFYLAQINPILGQIVGPSFGREDLPDVSMSLKPTDMMWPTTEYLIRIEPMKVVLAKGPLLHDLLSLLTRGDLEKGD
ncbi:uncharacterized protein [Physcomitrium patens]|uniref:Uncharacterized protein n=1 Tax=Physcomitrium patens TaxID=3218 RepID=A0A7I4BXR4_PHYPA|nr:uncharacterized protein LOC112285198 isoform X2 [Physcomitrium patens]|eukprot:XP_024381619.1 uncharacterized protein LOC112285198 isoform X2 [Physcomitrella patens]